MERSASPLILNSDITALLTAKTGNRFNRIEMIMFKRLSDRNESIMESSSSSMINSINISSMFKEKSFKFKGSILRRFGVVKSIM